MKRQQPLEIETFRVNSFLRNCSLFVVNRTPLSTDYKLDNSLAYIFRTNVYATLNLKWRLRNPDRGLSKVDANQPSHSNPAWINTVYIVYRGRDRAAWQVSRSIKKSPSATAYALRHKNRLAPFRRLHSTSSIFAPRSATSSTKKSSFVC